ncbi:MAG: 2-oxoacid:acceptor oxidoreductase family protein [Acidimicrobiales bacterium]
MERELLMTGIGGQGVQLASAVLAHAAVIEGREAQLFGSYAGMMRGGATATTVVVADTPIEAPPTVSRAWAVLVMHHEHAATSLARLRPNGLAFFDPTLTTGLPALQAGLQDATIVEVPAGELAREAGNSMAASMVMVAACAGATRLVGLASLIDATRSLLPAYRAQHLEVNERALRSGYAAAPDRLEAAWEDQAVAAR